jgi:hypothetical protein
MGALLVSTGVAALTAIDDKTELTMAAHYPAPLYAVAGMLMIDVPALFFGDRRTGFRCGRYMQQR